MLSDEDLERIAAEQDNWQSAWAEDGAVWDDGVKLVAEVRRLADAIRTHRERACQSTCVVCERCAYDDLELYAALDQEDDR